jgi:hypothetical protein
LLHVTELMNAEYWRLQSLRWLSVRDREQLVEADSIFDHRKMEHCQRHL